MTAPSLDDMLAAVRGVIGSYDAIRGGEREAAKWRAIEATLQQYERDDSRIRELDNENQRFMREVASLRQQHERAMKVVEAARDLLRYVGTKHPSSDTIVASRERAIALEAAALDAAETETGAGEATSK